MHNLPKGIRLSLARDAKPASPAVRAAGIRDVPQIWELVSTYSARGLLLPRTAADIAAKLDDYAVAADDCGRVLACASLEEYSPSLGEVASVAVAAAEHGKGLGTQVVRGIERLALARGINELFALSLTGDFFLSMGYELTTTSRYPEKLARYETLRSGGVEIIPKPCFKKQLDADWSAPQRYAEELPRRRMAG